MPQIRRSQKVIRNRRRPTIVRNGRVRLVKSNARLVRSNVNSRIRNRLVRLKRNLNKPTFVNNKPLISSHPTSSGAGRPRIVKGKPITQAGLSFLKCAFAPPDFGSTQVQGVPDSYRGMTLLKKHRLVQSTTVVTGTDYYCILAPVPGIAYFLGTTAAGVLPTGTTNWTGVPYTDFSTLFSTNANATADIINSFRFISNHIELICMSNQMTWSGSISAFKMPLRLIMKPGGLYTITGLQSTVSTNANQYTGTMFDGVYSGAYNSSPDFDFVDIIEAQPNARIPDVIVAGTDFGQLTSGASGFTGFDNNFESICIRLSGITSTNSLTIKTWACVEYRALDNSVLYEYQNSSPPEDETAIKLYREIALSLPVGVPVRENSEFWQRVLRIIKGISGFGMSLPGPYGAISGGVNAITSGIQMLSS